MEGLTQKHYMHRVPRERFVAQPRINLTWRYIVEHCRGCPDALITDARPFGGEALLEQNDE
eukprot:CAMPEP_0180826560 /NCGR_PEP_ID=MMETSP1038_2-20121128/73611_1 /TAXON_ID=632150 /ORGANISM="Azadinium spinosum, Strain 3D9" /LENGTH=60 /DNA_ID=CAMNT_0022869181 /DNA_START=45 /DNA_END=224 /DNA_ORIENTATION=-